MSPKTARELAETHRDDAWRAKFVRLCEVLDMLADCIIARDYSIPDDLNGAIALSEAGKELADRLIRKEGVPPKEAHLMCALTLGHDELLVEPEKCDLEKMVRAIEKQMLAREIRYPLVFGRDFYDTYAEHFEDEKDELSQAETALLLDSMPLGVYQYGPYVLGPFGILESAELRTIHASRHVPAFHCAQPSCKLVHKTYLPTSQDAPINELRTKLHRILDERGKPGEWWGLAQEITGFLDAMYEDRDAALLIVLIGDGLDSTELAVLLQHLLDHTKGDVRSRLPGHLQGSSNGITEGLNRAEVLQLLLLATEKQLRDAIDRLVRSQKIMVPPGEIRRPRINAARRMGAFELQAELGSMGIRYRAADPGLPALRLRRLLKRLYLESDEERAELEWQLRGYDADRIEDRLEDFYRAVSPREALTNLVLARRSNLVTAAHEVRLEDYDELSDAELIDSILWRLGFDVFETEDPHAYFWDLHERISSLTRSSRISGTGESETFRGVASTYFSELEGLLADSLAFTTWVLLNDHGRTSTFEFDEEIDRKLGLSLVQEAHLKNENPYEEFDFTSDRLELYPLFRGFAILADELERLEMSDDSVSRPADQLPDYDKRTDLKLFVLRSTVPYLDLLESSRSHIRQSLREVARILIDGKAHEVRNEYSHYRRKSEEIAGMTTALEAISAAVRTLEGLGFARITCVPTGTTVDPWGRSRHEFTGPRSRSYLFARPSSYDWMGLPRLATPQYIVQGAVFAEPNEVLRFSRRPRSGYATFWEGYPSRRAGGSESSSPDTHAAGGRSAERNTS